MCWTNRSRTEAPTPTTSILGGLKGSAANILVPDTTADLQGSSGVRPVLAAHVGCSNVPPDANADCEVNLVCLIGFHAIYSFFFPLSPASLSLLFGLQRCV